MGSYPAYLGGGNGVFRCKRGSLRNDVVLTKLSEEEIFPGWDFVMPLPLQEELLDR
jgi:hypothetical protein